MFLMHFMLVKMVYFNAAARKEALEVSKSLCQVESRLIDLVDTSFDEHVAISNFCALHTSSIGKKRNVFTLK